MLGDESWFDARRTAPGWKPGFFLNESPPLSALVVDRACYDRHVALQPGARGGRRFRRLLRAHGVSSGAVGSGRAPDGALALAQVESAPLAAILREMDRESDNFTAELLLKELGAEVRGRRHDGRRRRGRAARPRSGRRPARRRADRRRLGPLAPRPRDRARARALLVATWGDPDLRRPFWAALPVAGVNGTLEHRMR